MKRDEQRRESKSDRVIEREREKFMKVGFVIVELQQGYNFDRLLTHSVGC